MAAGPRTPPTVTAPSAVAAPPRSAMTGGRRLRALSESIARYRGAGSDRAVDRVTRGFGLVIGLFGTIGGTLILPEIIVQYRPINLIWVFVTVPVAFAMFPVLAVTALLADPPRIRQLAGVTALCYLVAMLLVLPHYHELLEGPGPIWAYRLIAIGVVAAALAWQPWFAAGYLVIVSAIPGVAGFVMADDTTLLTVADAFARYAGLCLLCLWCVVYARAAGVRVDRESDLAGERAAYVAASAARERERTRFAALIHDAVLSTLLDASRSGRGTSLVLQEQAGRALDQLDAVRITDAAADYLTVNSAIGFLRAAVHEVNTGIVFTAPRGGSDDALRLPVAAAGTLAAALAEAARNSLRHAGVSDRAVHREVTVTVGAGGLLIVLTDDGVGFDRDAVSVDRLGISVSILGRMRQLAGGAGVVESAPGKGTTVTLMWGSGAGGGEDG